MQLPNQITRRVAPRFHSIKSSSMPKIKRDIWCCFRDGNCEDGCQWQQAKNLPTFGPRRIWPEAVGSHTPSHSRRKKLRWLLETNWNFGPNGNNMGDLSRLCWLIKWLPPLGRIYGAIRFNGVRATWIQRSVRLPERERELCAVPF